MTGELFFFLSVFSYNGKREVTNMVIVNVKLLSGFSPDKLSLENVRNLSHINWVRQRHLRADHLTLHIQGMAKCTQEKSMIQLQRYFAKILW